MTTNEFYDFVNESELYDFRALLELHLTSGKMKEVIWITELPELTPSKDGRFNGSGSVLVFYCLTAKEHFMCTTDEIAFLAVKQLHYLT